VDYTGFQKTKKEKFTDSFFKNVLGNRNFSWNYLPANGTASGILVWVDSDVFKVISWDNKSFSGSIVVKIKFMVFSLD
jgi:hypothetical protein